MSNKKRKTNFKTMLKIFDDTWVKYGKGKSNFIDDWEEMLEKHGWTEEDFEDQLNNMYFKEEVEKTA